MINDSARGSLSAIANMYFRGLDGESLPRAAASRARATLAARPPGPLETLGGGAADLAMAAVTTGRDDYFAGLFSEAAAAALAGCPAEHHRGTWTASHTAKTEDGAASAAMLASLCAREAPGRAVGSEGFFRRVVLFGDGGSEPLLDVIARRDTSPAAAANALAEAARILAGLNTELAFSACAVDCASGGTCGAHAAVRAGTTGVVVRAAPESAARFGPETVHRAGLRPGRADAVLAVANAAGAIDAHSDFVIEPAEAITEDDRDGAACLLRRIALDLNGEYSHLGSLPAKCRELYTRMPEADSEHTGLAWMARVLVRAPSPIGVAPARHRCARAAPDPTAQSVTDAEQEIRNLIILALQDQDVPSLDALSAMLRDAQLGAPAPAAEAFALRVAADIAADRPPSTVSDADAVLRLQASMDGLALGVAAPPCGPARPPAVAAAAAAAAALAVRV